MSCSTLAVTTYESMLSWKRPLESRLSLESSAPSSPLLLTMSVLLRRGRKRAMPYLYPFQLTLPKKTCTAAPLQAAIRFTQTGPVSLSTRIFTFWRSSLDALGLSVPFEVKTRPKSFVTLAFLTFRILKWERCPTLCLLSATLTHASGCAFSTIRKTPFLYCSIIIICYGHWNNLLITFIHLKSLRVLLPLWTFHCLYDFTCTFLYTNIFSHFRNTLCTRQFLLYCKMLWFIVILVSCTIDWLV